MRRVVNIVMVVVVFAILAIAGSGHCAPTLEAEVSELAAALKSTQSTLRDVLGEMREQRREFSAFWKERPVFEADLQTLRAEFEAEQTKAATARAAIAARVSIVEAARWVGAGALAVVLWLLYWLRANFKPRIEER